MSGFIFLQSFTSLFTFLRFILIVEFFDTTTLGIYSYILSLIMLMSFVSQVIVNSAVQVNLIKCNDDLIVCRVMCSLFPIILLFFCISSTILFGINYFVNLDFDLSILVISSFFLLMNSLFELNFLVKKKLTIYYSSLLFSSFVTLCAVLLFHFINEVEYVYYLPVVTFISSFAFYLYFFITQVMAEKFEIKIDFKEVLSLYYKSWYINLIPLQNTLMDFVVKSAFMLFSSGSALGIYQLILSVEGLVGNVIMGPIYRYKLIKYSSDLTENYKKSISIDTVLIILLSTVLIVTGYLVYLALIYFDISLGVLSVIPLLLLVLIARVSWYVWGVIAQAALAKGLAKTVTIIEVINKGVVTIVTCTLLYFALDESSYIYAIYFLSFPMMLVSFYVFKRLR